MMTFNDLTAENASEELIRELFHDVAPETDMKLMAALGAAVTVFNETGSMPMAFTLITPKGPETIFAPHESRVEFDAVLQALRDRIKETNASRYIAVSETWSRVVKKDTPDPDLLPSEAPDRTEAICAVDVRKDEHGWVTATSYSVPITRDEHGKGQLGTLDVARDITGNLASLFDDEKGVSQ